MSRPLANWLAPQRPAATEPVGQATRRLLGTEILVVLTITLGLSALRSALALINALLQPEPLSSQQVALNAPASQLNLVDLAFQLVGALQLLGWGALGGYLLLRSGIALRAVGLDARRPGRDALGAMALAAVIGIPGLGLYLVAHTLGVSLTVAPTTLTDTWWRIPVLVVSAAANAWAEELIMIGWLLTRLRQLGWSENRSLLAAALLRGSYHLYQGLGGFLGNFIMGCIFGRVWQRQGRLWCLVGAHTLIDVVAFVGYGLLKGKVGWLP
jgi:membrane protease YdiL (CAAX protease family)